MLTKVLLEKSMTKREKTFKVWISGILKQLGKVFTESSLLTQVELKYSSPTNEQVSEVIYAIKDRGYEQVLLPYYYENLYSRYETCTCNVLDIKQAFIYTLSMNKYLVGDSYKREDYNSEEHRVSLVCDFCGGDIRGELRELLTDSVAATIFFSKEKVLITSMMFDSNPLVRRAATYALSRLELTTLHINV